MLKTPPGVIGEFTKQIMLPPAAADYEKLLNQIVQKSAVSVGGIDTGTWGSALTISRVISGFCAIADAVLGVRQNPK